MEHETALDNQIPTEKVYKDKEVWVGSMLGGPLTAGYLIAKNFKVFGEAVKARNTLIIAVAATVITFSIAFFAPYADRLPNFVLPLIYTGIAYLLVQIHQGEKIKAHIRAGGQIQSWWKTIGVSVIGIIITIIPIFGIAFLVETTANANITAKNYGLMKHEIAFDKSNLTESEADALAEGLRKATFFDDEYQKFVYVKKVDNNYEISILVNKSASNNPQVQEPFAEMRNEMQTLFPNNKIIINLIVNDLDNIVKRLE